MSYMYKKIYLLSQCICHDDIVGIPGLLAHVVRYISRLCRTRSILQAPEIGLDFIKIGL